MVFEAIVGCLQALWSLLEGIWAVVKDSPGCRWGCLLACARSIVPKGIRQLLGPVGRIEACHEILGFRVLPATV